MKPKVRHTLTQAVLAVVLLLTVGSLAKGQSAQGIYQPDPWVPDDSPSLPPIPRFDMYEAMSQPEAALGDSNVTLVGRWPWGPCTAVAMQGSYVYIGNGDLFQVLDISDPSDPFLVGEILIPRIVWSIDVSGQYAYVGVASGLQIIDVSPPTNPEVVGEMDILGGAIYVQVPGKYAYVGDRSGKVYIVDVSTPSQPIEVGRMRAYGFWVTAVAVAGDTVCIGAADGMVISFFNVSDPENPDPFWWYFTGATLSLDYADGHLFVGAGRDPEFRILDLSRPLGDWEVGRLDLVGVPYGTPYGMAVVGGYAYLAIDLQRFSVVDISDVAEPVEVAHIDWEGPSRSGPDDLVVSGDIACGQLSMGVWIVDVSVPEEPEEVSIFPTGHWALNVAIDGDYAYVADCHAGLWIVDVSSPTEPKSMGNFLTQGCACDVAVSDGYAYVVNCPNSDQESGGLWIVDVSDPGNPRGISFFRGIYNTVKVSGDYVYLTQVDSGLQIIDVSDPGCPVEAAFFPSESLLYDVAVCNNYACLAETEAGLRIVDVSDPTEPIEIGSLDFEGHHVVGVVAEGNEVYVAVKGGLSVVDVSEPEEPTELGYVYLGSGWTKPYLCVSGHYVYVAFGGAVRFVDVASPSNPRVFGAFSTLGDEEGMASKGAYVYVACFNNGLFILQNELWQGEKGDVDRDGDIDIADVIATVNIMVGFLPDANANELWAADYNDDGSVNVLDIVAMVNSILGRPGFGKSNLGNGVSRLWFQSTD